MKIKVCGMRNTDNIKDLSALLPDYIGFIFYPKSKRYVNDKLDLNVIASLHRRILKVGVFVNSELSELIDIYQKYKLDIVQLHGNESVDYCKQLAIQDISVIKAFGVSDDFDFDETVAYKPFCKYFLFDTKHKDYGGSGHKFNWQIFQHYDNDKPFFLSGGIDVEDIETIKNITTLKIHAIDINSKFEIEPGFKDISKVKEFIEKIRK